MSEILNVLDVNSYNMQSMVAGAGKMQEKTATPTTSQQVIEPDQGYDGMSSVTVNAVTSAIDENIIPTNIRTGKTILGVQGNLEPDKPDQNKTVTPSTVQQVIVADIGYELAQVTVEAVQTETKTVKSTTTSQTVIPTSGKLINEITVSPIDLETKTVTPSTSQQVITPTSGKDGISEVTVNAISLQSKDITITENGTTTVTPDTGYDGLSDVDVTVNGILDVTTGDYKSINTAIEQYYAFMYDVFNGENKTLYDTYLQQPLTLYAPNDVMPYFLITKNLNGGYRIFWTKTFVAKSSRTVPSNLNLYVGFFDGAVERKDIRDSQNNHKYYIPQLYQGYGYNLSDYPHKYSNEFETLDMLIEAISNPSSEITYTFNQDNYFKFDPNELILTNNNLIFNHDGTIHPKARFLSNDITIVVPN